MRPIISILFCALLNHGIRAAPVINEILTENDRLFLDADNDSPDWIEIYHPGPGSLDLAGYYLSDDTNLTQWAFASNTVMLANSYLLVYASGKDRRDPTGELHTNFSLQNSGESIILTAPDGTSLVSAIDPYPEQRRNISYGRLPGGGSLGFFETPSPGALNNAGVIDFVKDTQFSTLRGFHTASFFLSITSSTPNVTVRYTTDGSPPSESLGFVYVSPIFINQTTTIRAMAYRGGWKSTNVDAQSYIFPSDVINQAEIKDDIINDPRYTGQIDTALRSLPVVSLQFTDSDLFGINGIYENPHLSGDTSERAVHIEYFNPNDPEDTFHIAGGIRIHGGNARSHPKKSLRLYFRAEYGDNRLNHDLYPDSPVKSFKRLLLRAGGHDAWTFRSSWDQASYIRNEFLHQLQLAMDQPSPRGKLVHVYLNGAYWGFYDLQELPHADYYADYHGGEKLDWDVIKHGGDAEDGNLTAWNELMSRTASATSSDAAYAQVQEYIDLDNFIDSMIHRIWSSDEDWLGPMSRNGSDITKFANKNWYAARKSRNGIQPFRFYCWDAEMSMGIPFAASRGYENNLTLVDDTNSPGQIYDALRSHPAFRIRFGDRLHKHCFNDGPFTSTRLKLSWTNLVNQAELPMIAESARWGLEAWGSPRTTVYTKDDQWRPAVDWVHDTFLTFRTTEVLSQFQTIGLYPSVAAPTFSHNSGRFDTGFTLSMTSPGSPGVLYYTRNGEDPMNAVTQTSVDLIDESTNVQALVPTFGNGGATLGNSWIQVADPANIASWKSGANGVGYETFPADYASLIQVDVSEMSGVNATCFIRIPFSIPDQATLDAVDTLTLNMRYDDGYVAYLNGTRIAARNDPPLADLDWIATSSAQQPDSRAVIYDPEDVSSHIDQLVVGPNLLAIHALNRRESSSDLLIMALLTGTSSGTASDVNTHAVAYSDAFAITGSETITARFRADNGAWSALNEASYVIGVPATSNRLAITEIMYHPDDAFTAAELTVATVASDFEYLEILNVHTQTVDLTDCYFTQGVNFHFPAGYFLDPGERTLVVNYRPAFIARYGGEHASRIAGAFENETKLADTGERLTLVDGDGLTIFSVRYRDADGWPSVADGDGNSLVRVNPFAPSDLDAAAAWRASYAADGQPGQDDSHHFDTWMTTQFNREQLGDPAITGILAVPPGESLNNLVRYAFARELVPASEALVTPFETNGYLAVRFRNRIEAPDIEFQAWVSANLVDWDINQPGFTYTTSQTMEDHGDGTRTTGIFDLNLMDRRYLRLELNQTPNP